MTTIDPPKYVPQGSERFSIANDLHLLAARDHMEPAKLPEITSTKYSIKSYHAPEIPISKYGLKTINENNIETFKPESHRTYELVDPGLCDLWGVPKHEIKPDLQPLYEYGMEGLNDRDLLVMRLQNEAGVENHLSNVLEEKVLENPSMDAYMVSLDKNIKEKYTMLREKNKKTESTADQKEANEISSISDNDSKVVPLTIPLTKPKKVKIKVEPPILPSEITVVETSPEKKVKIKKEKLPKDTIPIQAPEFSFMSEEKPDSVKSVGEAVARIEPLSFYVEKLSSAKNKGVKYQNTLNDSNLVDGLLLKLQSLKVPLNEISQATTTSQMINLINRHDPDAWMRVERKKTRTPKKKKN